ncbi:hypothetical protein D3C78_1937830 [compost metagenome]
MALICLVRFSMEVVGVEYKRGYLPEVPSGTSRNTVGLLSGRGLPRPLHGWVRYTTSCLYPFVSGRCWPA